MTLRQFEVFLAVARARSFRRAAETRARSPARDGRLNLVTIILGLEFVADPPAPQREARHERIGDTHMLQWSGDGGGIHHRRALEMWQAAGAPDARMGARLYAKLAEAPTRWRGAFKTPPPEGEIIGWIEAGLDLLRDKEPCIEKARLLMARAVLPNFTGRRDEDELRAALASAEEALPIMEALGTARDVSPVLDAIGAVRIYLADYPAALECNLRRRDLGPLIENRAELIDIGCMLSQAYSALGRYADAVREAQAAADLGEIGLGGWHVHALLWRTWAHFAGDSGMTRRGRSRSSCVSGRATTASTRRSSGSSSSSRPSCRLVAVRRSRRARWRNKRKLTRCAACSISLRSC